MYCELGLDEFSGEWTHGPGPLVARRSEACQQGRPGFPRHYHYCLFRPDLGVAFATTKAGPIVAGRQVGIDYPRSPSLVSISVTATVLPDRQTSHQWQVQRFRVYYFSHLVL